MVGLGLCLLLVMVACSGAGGGRRAPSAPAGGDVPGVVQRVEPPLPDVRQETAAAAGADGLWVVGGYDGRSRSSPDVLRFDGAAWHREPPLPVAVDHPSAAALGGAVYVAGGFDGGVASRRVFRLPGNHEAAPMRHARGALALVPLAGRLYAIGGNDARDQVAPAEEYDPGTNTWRDLPDLPAPRNHVAGFAYRGMACVAGGRSPNVAAVTCWDPARERWLALPPLPMPTSGAGAAVLDGEPLVAGGEDPVTGRVVTQLARLHDGAWRLGQMRQPRHGIQLAPYRGRLWACGGGDRAGLHPVSTCTSVGAGR